jgi:accessory gene regulator B
MKNPIDIVAIKLAQFVKNNYDSSDSIGKLTYSSIILVNTLVAVLISFIICIFTGHLSEFAIVFVALIILRYFTGGAHMKTSLGCCIFTIVVIVAVVHTTYSYVYLGLIFDMISLILFAYKAPSDIDVIRKVSPRVKMTIKILFMFVISVNFVLQSTLLSSIIIVQALSLTSTFEKFLYYIEGKIAHD